MRCSKRLFFLFTFWMMVSFTQAQVIISQYYEGGGTNKWIELTNLGNTAVSTASPQLKLGLWAQAGSTGNINITGLPAQTVDLNFTIPAHGSVLVGNPANGTEVPYLNSSSAIQNSSLVINFNGNDGIALLDNNGNIIDQFGQGINAADKSYYRNLSVTAPSAGFVLQEWTNVSLATVQAASIPDVARLNYHLQNNCTAPVTGASNIVYYTIKPNSIGGAFTPGTADEYLVLLSTSPTLSALPQNNIVYQAGNTIGNATVINRSSTNVFYAPGLTPSTAYYFFVFALNSNCTGGPVYAADYLTGTRSTTAVPAPQPYSIYFGNLHSHSSFSDGNADDPLKTPADDYAFARESMCMDFLGISEHNHTGAGMKLANWQPGKNQAAASTTPDFVAMYGLEWGVIEDGGHAVVYGMDSLPGWETDQYQVFVARGNFSGTGGLFEKINQKGGNAFTYLAHPVITDYNNIFSNNYSLDADNAIVGTAIESGPAFSTSISYNNAGVPMGFLDFYKILLSKGYHVGPLIDHDNHNLTFGRTARTRLAIIAPDLSEMSLLSAVKQMRFYATEDCSAKVRFTVAGEQMGSIMIRPGTPQLNIQYETSSPVSSVKIMYGTPGSGSFPVQLTSLAPGITSYTDATLQNFGQRYYYFDITETDGTRIITSPIWYTRVDGALASSGFNTFTAVNQPGDVLLKWSITAEANNTAFGVERSVDGGRSFQVIGTQPGRGFTSTGHEYTFIDAAPFTGAAYYRIASITPGEALQYSPQRLIKRGGAMQNMVSIYPNPVDDIANIHVNAIANGSASVVLLDMSGRKLSAMNFVVKKGEQVLALPMFTLAKGQYAIRLMLNGEQFTRLINKQ